MKNFFALSIVLILMASCQPQNNAPQSQSDAPTINSLTITNTNIQIEDGAFLEFICEFSDDNGLNKYRVTILDNCPTARLKSAPWYIDELDFDISGTSFIDTVQLFIPYHDIEACEYELTVIVQDIDGEETSQTNTFYVIE